MRSRGLNGKRQICTNVSHCHRHCIDNTLKTNNFYVNEQCKIEKHYWPVNFRMNSVLHKTSVIIFIHCANILFIKKTLLKAFK